MPIIPIRQK